MAGIAAGDASSLSALYDRYSGIVLATCLRILNDRADAEEVLGDVFWQVWEQAGRFDAARGSTVTWILTLARSRSIDRWRSIRTRARISEPEEAGAEPGAPPAAAEAFASVLQSQQRSALQGALGRLDASQREALELAYYGGLTHSEISGRLGVPLGTIKTRIRQGLIRLKDSLAAEFDGGALA